MEKTVYKLENDVVYYSSIKIQFPGTILTETGILGQNSVNKVYYHSNIDEAEDNYGIMIRELEKAYCFKPKFTAVKIGVNLSDLDIEDQLNEWILITQGLENFLWVTGNGFVYNDTFDIKKNNAVCSYSKEGVFYTAIFSSINPRDVIGYLQIYLNKFLDPLPLVILESEVDMTYRESLDDPLSEEESDCEFPF